MYLKLFLVLDCLTDGYRWRDNSWSPFLKTGKLRYYNLITGKKYIDENGKEKIPQTNEFKRRLYSHPDFPEYIVVRYIGDEKIVKQFPHGNAYREEKLSKGYFRNRAGKF